MATVSDSPNAAHLLIRALRVSREQVYRREGRGGVSAVAFLGDKSREGENK